MLNWIARHHVHILIWAIFIFYETMVIGLIFNVFGNPATYFVHYLIIIAFFYVNSDFVLPWCLEKKGSIWWRLPMVVVFSLAMYIVLHYFADLLLMFTSIIPDEGKYPFSYQFILKNIYRGIYFFGFSTGYYILKTRDVERQEKEAIKQLHFENMIKRQEIEKELQETRNSFLKAQINPHFLFNTLDFVYHAIHSKPDVASETIVHLSRIMRFAIDSDKNGEFVKVAEEVTYIRTLVSLYQLRKADNTFPLIECSSDAAKMEIIPLVILTLVENMIKHGNFSSASSSGHFRVVSENGELYISTKNLSHQYKVPNSSNTGLENIKKRLFHAYGEGAELKYSQDADHNFLLNIRIRTVNLAPGVSNE